MKMKAAVYYGPGDIRIEEMERPKPGKEGMLVKVGACGICELIDMPHYKMDFPLKDVPAHYNKDLPPNRPIVLGHEFSGEVVEVGSEVTVAKPGDKVYGILYEPCGICPCCQAGNPDECKYIDGGGRTINGAMAEYALFPKVTLDSYKEDKLVKIPDNMSYRNGALIEVLVLSFGLSKKVNDSDTVVVFGQDLMGLGITAHLKKREVAKVITCDVSKKRLEASKEMGADVVVDALNENILDVVLEETKDKGADIVLETSCRSESLQQAVTAVRPFGKIWLATSYTKGPFFDPTWQGPGMVSMNLTMKMGISIHCAWGTLGPWMPRMHEAIEMIQSGLITADKYATFFPLDKAKEAFETANDPHKSIKVIIEP
jgi:threonine dehydrogenase-like Zn-dependent dehydrogenase